MSDTGLTTMSVKKINKNKVYNLIYREKVTSKQQIVQKLQMSLSTVSQNLRLLEDEGLIERKGFFDSTGGRKAQAIQIVKTARTAIGVGILKDRIYMAAVDLYGASICEKSVLLPYMPQPSYYQRVGQFVTGFIQENRLPESSVPGISIATQGILAPDGKSVSYGAIMGNSNMKLTDFEQYLPFPCRLEHDSKAAATLELWNHSALKNAIVLLLNPNLGGAVITDGNVQRGEHMRSGTVEHICLNPKGPLCYCGSKGCLETYCSAGSLETAAGMEIPAFFSEIKNQPKSALRQIWTDYLKNLAFAIRNLRLVIDGDVIISGYLAPYFCEDDVLFLLEQVNGASPFPISRKQIWLGTHGEYTPAIGGTLPYIEDFLASI